MTAFKIEVKDGGVTDTLNRLAAAAGNPEPAMRAIGEALLALTRRTFEAATDPWGRRWKPNAPSTIAAMLARSSGNFRKRDGKLSAKGAKRVMTKRPLIGETGILSGASLSYAVSGPELTLGSSAIQAAILHLGGKAGRGHKVEIPSRLFLPVNAVGEMAPEASQTVVDVIQEYLLASEK